MSTDAAALTAELIRCPSVTPEEGGALVRLEVLLAAHGFRCTRIDRGGVANLYARWGEAGPVFGFNGHTDVVPPGDVGAWTHPPFSGAEHGGEIWGRGAVDMKSGVAAFAAAACDLVGEAPPKGSIALLITGDEEGVATDGTVAILDWMKKKGERLDHCIVGEPTCPNRLGDMIKIGRRGSMTGYFTARGVQGHSAYPHRAKNPLPPLVKLLDRLAEWDMDAGTEHFDPSTLAITTVDVGNPANNVIPAEGRATVNIRFNDAHSSASVRAKIEKDAAEIAGESGVALSVRWQVSGESFLTPPGALSSLVSEAVEAETGIAPVLSTSGGTSDARFIKDHCPVIEFGLVGATMHQVDERVPVDEVRALKAVYRRVLDSYFSR